MFSSLPSASKIYVQSSKTKHKNLNSAKRRRKKSVANSCTPVHVHEEETLVSSTSVHNLSTSQLSLNSHEESFKSEINCESDREFTNAKNNDGVNCDEKIVTSLNVKCINNTEDVFINEMHKSELSSCLISMKSPSVINENGENESVENENSINVTTDSIYCDEFTVSDNHSTKEIQTNCMLQGSKSVLQISDAKLLEDGSERSDKQNINHEDVESALPQIQVVCDNPDLQGVDKITDNKELVLSCKKDQENCFVNSAKDAIYEDFQCYKDDLSSTTVYSENTTSENSEALCNDLCVGKENNNTLKIVSDIDSSSVRSDCCQSANIYDIHVINSEHSSVDENQMSAGEDCRIQSPEPSEKSCTESVMYDFRSICQNELPSQHSLNMEIFSKKNAITESSHENLINTKVNSENVTSVSLTNFEKFKTNDVITHSISLPENLNSFRNIGVFDNKLSHKVLASQQNNSDRYISRNSKICDTSDKSTDTSDTISAYFNKKDIATTPLKNKNLSPFKQNKSIASSLKDSSMLIMKVLPPVAVLQARARSYVFGSIGPTKSLLGNEELSRFFPDNKMTIFVGTWNMNGHDPPESIDDFLLPLDISSVPDIYAIGIQESMQSRSEWEILLQTTLGPSHVLFASTSFGVLHLSIFMRRDLIWFCSEPEEANVAVRPGSMIKTKGAVAICFMFFGTSFLFVNSHLTAHEQKLRERLSDYEKICASLDLPKQIPLKPHQKGKDVTSLFDCVFWCGDLNFRVVQDRSSVLSFVEEKIRRQSSCNSLTEHDQLTQAMAKGTAFHGFCEGMINFIPSYKFDVGTSFFDSTKQRVPSYTDRILYRCRDKSSIICLHYNAVNDILTSDHKPVYSVFNVSLKPGRDNIPLSGGLFKREIYLEAIKRRAAQLEVTRNHKQSTICSIM